MNKDTRKRSFLKAITWRIIASTATFALAYLLTSDLSVSAGIGVLDMIAKFILYYLHERGWKRIKWGS